MTPKKNARPLKVSLGDAEHEAIAEIIAALQSLRRPNISKGEAIRISIHEMRATILREREGA